MVELGSEGMSAEVSTSLFLVFFRGSVEYGLESRNRDIFVAGCGHGVNGGLMGSSWLVLLGIGLGTHTASLARIVGWTDALVPECGSRIRADGSLMAPPLLSM